MYAVPMTDNRRFGRVSARVLHAYYFSNPKTAYIRRIWWILDREGTFWNEVLVLYPEYYKKYQTIVDVSEK